MAQMLESQAPTRIDLAGGTLDLWPLYLFFPGCRTINLGIDLFAESKLEVLPGEGVTLVSQDQNHELTFSWAELEQQNPGPAVELHYKLLRFFQARAKEHGRFDPKMGVRLSTRAKSPAGAGLGGSSTLAVSMIGALQKWSTGDFQSAREGEALIHVIRDIETTVIKVPAGVQDYFGAMFGGLQSLRWGVGTHERRSLPTDLLPELESRLQLFYSGHSRNSGINNWALYKALIDRDADTHSRFKRIHEATLQLETALEKRDWDQAGQAIAAEWSARRELAKGITTPEMDRAFETARTRGATAGKVCGAGGGGCFFVYRPKPWGDDGRALSAELERQGLRPLPFHAVPHGVTVRGG